MEQCLKPKIYRRPLFDKQETKCKTNVFCCNDTSTFLSILPFSKSFPPRNNEDSHRRLFSLQRTMDVKKEVDNDKLTLREIF